MHKAVVLCQQHDKASRHLHPQLMCNPGPLTATFKRPEKDAAVAGFVSRFAKVTKLVGRAKPPPDQEEPPGGSQTSVGRGKMTPGVQVKGKRRKEVEQHLPPKRTKRKTAKKMIWRMYIRRWYPSFFLGGGVPNKQNQTANLKTE